jgi:predicted SAM-dependent methyltransferase
MKLEVGSGNHPIPGYRHCDINPDLPDIDYVCPMWDIPEDDGFFSEVRAIHVIEHAPRTKWLDTLNEWYRVLEPGGLVWIDTPNLDRNISLYVHGGWIKDFEILTPEEQRACSIGSLPDAALWLNFKMFSTHVEHDTHYGNFTPDLLLRYCMLIGFKDVQIGCADPSLVVTGRK